jgi:hypothetical protein
VVLELLQLQDWVEAVVVRVVIELRLGLAAAVLLPSLLCLWLPQQPTRLRLVLAGLELWMATELLVLILS